MPRNTKAEKEAKRRIVARGVVAGKKTRAIAREAGCKERHVERLAAEPATQLIVTELMRPHHKKLATLAKKAVAAVERGLDAKTRRGTPIHEIQLRAVGRFADLAHLAQGDQVASSDEAGLVTWEQFLVLYRSRTVSAA